jgi:hypothetical protein
VGAWFTEASSLGSPPYILSVLYRSTIWNIWKVHYLVRILLCIVTHCLIQPGRRVDQKCLFHQKPMLESGTLGAKVGPFSGECTHRGREVVTVLTVEAQLARALCVCLQLSQHLRCC